MATPAAYEFQRLHGMGETFARHRAESKAPAAASMPPLARTAICWPIWSVALLENGANSSFVNQIVDEDVPPRSRPLIPFDVPRLRADHPTRPASVRAQAPKLKGFDLTHAPTLAAIEAARAPFRRQQWTATPMLAGDA